MGADKRDKADRVAELLASLSELTVFELREEWRRHHRMAPPKRLSRDLLLRGIAFKLQESLLGGHSKATLRRLAGIASEHQRSIAAYSRPTIMLKPGTRLVREWHGVTHTVLVDANDFVWHGRRFASLSEIARAITGAHWSGPRFFGLKAPNRTRVETDGYDGDS